MSGLEALGVAASVVQIAELGARLSVKLYTYSIKTANSNAAITAIHRDVALTSSVLGELGQTLSESNGGKQWAPSKTAILTAMGLLDECKKLFADLEGHIESHNGESKSKMKDISRSLKYPFIEPTIEVLRCQLDRLKSSLLLMLNVMVYARLQR